MTQKVETTCAEVCARRSGRERYAPAYTRIGPDGNRDTGSLGNQKVLDHAIRPPVCWCFGVAQTAISQAEHRKERGKRSETVL